VVIFAKIVQYSYDPEKEVIPQFHILTETKKQFIASELEKEVEQVLEFQKILSEKWFLTSSREEKIQKWVNEVLKSAYGYISHGYGWTRPDRTIQDWTFWSEFLPAGQEDKTVACLGQTDSDVTKVSVWKEIKGDDRDIYRRWGHHICIECEAGHIHCNKMMPDCCDPSLHWSNVMAEWTNGDEIIPKVGAYKIEDTWYLAIDYDDDLGPRYRNRKTGGNKCPNTGWELRHGKDEWRDYPDLTVCNM